MAQCDLYDIIVYLVQSYLYDVRGESLVDGARLPNKGGQQLNKGLNDTVLGGDVLFKQPQTQPH